MDRDYVQKQTGRVREADKLGCLATEEEENKCALKSILSAFCFTVLHGRDAHTRQRSAFTPNHCPVSVPSAELTKLP